MRRISILLCLLAAGCRPAEDPEVAAPAEHPDNHSAAAAEHAMAGSLSEDPHLRLTTPGKLTRCTRTSVA